MSTWKNEAEAREQIKALVGEYYHQFKEKKAPYREGERINYAARVFDEKEMCALTDAMLDFLGKEYERSKLYDPAFSTGFRQAADTNSRGD